MLLLWQSILPSSGVVTQMLRMLGSEVKVVFTKAMAIQAMAMAMIRVMSRPMVGPISWMPMSSRGI